MMKHITRLVTFSLLIPTMLINTGCATVVVAGVAAAGGYIAHEKGYRVRNPITKTKQQQ